MPMDPVAASYGTPLTEPQRRTMLAILQDHSIILKKSQDRRTIRKKREAWDQITRAYNELFPVEKGFVPRTTVFLKRWWENYKAGVKKKAAEGKLCPQEELPFGGSLLERMFPQSSTRVPTLAPPPPPPPPPEPKGTSGTSTTFPSLTSTRVKTDYYSHIKKQNSSQYAMRKQYLQEEHELQMEMLKASKEHMELKKKLEVKKFELEVERHQKEQELFALQKELLLAQLKNS